jgi:acyl-CoA reductase-like NAD-dependent aldehyde dehydrogenase
VQRGIYDKFATLLAEKTRALRVGHGLEEGTTMGALTVPQGIDKTASQVADAEENGGTILTGGNRVNLGEGYFFEPTIIANATPCMKIASEETFGPLLALFAFDTEEEAVKAANNTSVSFRYELLDLVGLASSVDRAD